MTADRKCEECGTALPAKAPLGLCPRCLAGMGLQLAPDPGAEGEPSEPPAWGKDVAQRTGAGASVTERPGVTIGRYKLVEKLGEGGFGVVYVAEQDEPVKRQVALKIIKLGMDTNEVVARFEAERQALAVMDHPNIAKVLDGGATRTGRPYFVMELVRGTRITRYCEQNRLSVSERLRLFLEVCDAIQHAHQKGIIHRDITPSNILVTVRDGVPVPKVIDFGIAKATQQELTEKRIYTQSQQFIGTPAYMSPEQAEFSGLNIDTRSDIYSLGVVLYELLTGVTPFDAQELLAAGLDAMRRTIREVEPLKPSTRARQQLLVEQKSTRSATTPASQVQLPGARIDPDLDWIVMKCLEKDRTRRYDTASGLAADLRRYFRDEPIEARPPSVGYRLRKLVRRNRLAFAATSAIATLLVAGGVVSAWLAVRATRAEKRAEGEALRAVEKSALAEAQRLRAEQQSEVVRLLSYVDAMNVAQRYCQETNFDQALSLLGSHPPRGAKEDWRGFEWRHLYWICRGNYAMALPTHKQVLGTMEFSPDGRMLATYCWDRKIRLWQAEEGSSSAKLLFETGAATGLGGFTTDGEQLVFGSLGGSIQRYAIREGRLHPALHGAGELIAFSARADLIVTLGADHRVWLSSLTAGESRPISLSIAQRYLEFGWTDRLALSPDGTWLAVIESAEGPESLRRDVGIRLWDLRAGQDRGVLSDPRQIRSLRFSPDARFLAVGDGQGRVNLWNLATREQRTLVVQELPILSLAFSPDGSRLATGTADQSIQLWDVATGARQGSSLRGQVGGVFSLAFSPTGHRLASGSRDSSVKIWDLAQTEAVDPIPGLHTEDYGNFAFSPDGKLMAAGSRDDRVVVWEVATLRTNAVLDGMRYVVGFSQDSRYLLVSSGDQLGHWCSLADKTCRPLPGHRGDLRNVKCVDLSPDRRLAALGYESGMIELWELAAGKASGSFPAHTGRVRTVSFSADGNTLVSGGSDRAVKLWDVSRQTLLAEKVEHKGALCAAVISRDGTRLASGCGAGTIKLWDPANLGSALITIPCHKSAIRVLDFSGDGKTLASGGEDKTVKLWNVASLTLPSPREVASFQLSDKVRLLRFSPDDNALAIVTDDGVLRLLRAVSLKDADEEMANLKP